MDSSPRAKLQLMSLYQKVIQAVTQRRDAHIWLGRPSSYRAAEEFQLLFQTVRIDPSDQEEFAVRKHELSTQGNHVQKRNLTFPPAHFLSKETEALYLLNVRSIAHPNVLIRW